MSSFLMLPLKTELTCIPNVMHKFLGTSFNNTLCNGITWFLVFWLGVHSCYTQLMNILLRHLCFPTYQRIRLASSLWNLTLYGCFLSYYLLKNRINNLSDYKSMTVQDSSAREIQVAVYAALCSFYMFMGYRQGTQQNSFTTFLRFEAFASVCIAAYMLDVLGVCFTITALVAVTKIFQELSRTSYSLLNKTNKIAKLFILAIFVWTVLIFSITHLVAIPLLFLRPLGAQILSGRLELIPLLAALLIWLGLAGYKSILHNLLIHWTKHLKILEDTDDDHEVQLVRKQPYECLGNVLACSLFPPRQDDAYMLSLYRSEAKDRQQQMIAKRKPKNKNMIIQTLKCMMAIKRKLCEKKANQTLAGDNTEQEEDSVLLDEETIVDSREDAIAMKRSEKLLDVSDKNHPPGLTDPIVKEESDIENTEEESELRSVDYIFENPVNIIDDLTDPKSCPFPKRTGEEVAEGPSAVPEISTVEKTCPKDSNDDGNLVSQ